MRRFGDRERFLQLLASVRALAPAAGARSNFIVGFPGETKADVAELERFLVGARLDAVGMFGYSDEEGTEAATFDRKIRRDTIERRLGRVTRLVEELVAQRAEERIGETLEVLVESVDDGTVEGRAAHQAPETDGTTTVRGAGGAQIGDLVRCVVDGTDGVDLRATAVDAVTTAAIAG
jgi:tRNA A37 methylthiotransferase MiaB